MRNWYDRLWGPAFAPCVIKSVSTETGDNMEESAGDEDDIVAAAERQYARENDTPTEPRSDLD